MINTKGNVIAEKEEKNEERLGAIDGKFDAIDQNCEKIKEPKEGKFSGQFEVAIESKLENVPKRMQHAPVIAKPSIKLSST